MGAHVKFVRLKTVDVVVLVGTELEMIKNYIESIMEVLMQYEICAIYEYEQYDGRLRRTFYSLTKVK